MGAVDEALVVDQEGAALARDQVLGLVEAHRRKVPDAAERTVLVVRRDALRRVLQNEETVPLRDLHDLVHGTADARVVNHEDGLGLLRDGRLDQVLVDVERVGPDVHEDRHGTAQNHGIRGRHEGERRHDDLVARFELEQHGGHLHGGRAGVRQKGLAASDLALEPRIATLRERAVPAQMAAFYGFEQITGLVPGRQRPVERNTGIEAVSGRACRSDNVTGVWGWHGDVDSHAMTEHDP